MPPSMHSLKHSMPQKQKSPQNYQKPSKWKDFFIEKITEFNNILMNLVNRFKKKKIHYSLGFKTYFNISSYSCSPTTPFLKYQIEIIPIRSFSVNSTNQEVGHKVLTIFFFGTHPSSASASRSLWCLCSSFLCFTYLYTTHHKYDNETSK